MLYEKTKPPPVAVNASSINQPNFLMGPHGLTPRDDIGTAVSEDYLPNDGDYSLLGNVVCLLFIIDSLYMILFYFKMYIISKLTLFFNVSQ